nr:putative disease resistance RPP13-like protein 3 [Setaria viridis]
MADSAVSFVLGRLGEFVVKEARALQEVGNDVVLLKDKLQWLHTFVQQADHRRRCEGNTYMDVWVQQTREVALDVEDVLDEFMRRVDLQQGLPAWRKWLKFLRSCASQISVRRELSGRIAMIRARLDQISDHRSAYITDYSSSLTRESSSPSITTVDGWDEALEVVGFRNEYLSLERLLREGDGRRSIVWIVGESGVGKTTLARTVYDSPAVQAHFKARVMWNLAPCTTEDVALCEIYQHLRPPVHAPATVEGIRDALSKYLKEKRYLIVLDGAAKLFNWSSVLDVLPDNHRGSRVVIVNSLNDHEALVPGGKHDHKLTVQLLDQKNSNLLFRRHALGLGSESSFGKSYFWASAYERQMSKAFKDMFEITSGLPLAILLLGRLLRRKVFPEQWEDVLKHLKSMKPSSRVEGVLALSFDDLPHYLKSCFLYFAMMPQNMSYSAAGLVRIWAAEGFLKPRRGQSMEDAGHSYLKELISRGMVHVFEKGPVASEESTLRTVVIHQRLHAMARFETEGSFLDVYDCTDIPASSTGVRHLYIQNLSNAAYTHMEGASFPKLRSVSCDFSEYWEYKAEEQQHVTAGHQDQPYHDSFLGHLGRSNLLRVIDLGGLQVKRLPSMIGSLVHLRYLCIQRSCLVELPSTIANLINLQTLDIIGTKVKRVTPAFWAIPTLRHVRAEMLHMPKPKSAGVLKSMQSLVGMVCVHPWHNNISPLHKMINVRELDISSLNSDHWGALSDAFKQLESLLYLRIRGCDIPALTLFTKFNLRRLQRLKLDGRIFMSAKEEAEEQFTLPNLTSLLLMHSGVKQGFIDKIGKLPRLVRLELYEKSYEGEELVFTQESGFVNLTHLGLRSLPGLSKWKIVSESLPNVEKVIVNDCTNMKLEVEGGVQVLKNLTKFKVIDMPKKWGVEEAGPLSEKFVQI